ALLSGLAVDPTNDDVVVTGYFLYYPQQFPSDPSFSFGDIQTSFVVNAGEEAAFVGRFDAAGHAKWIRKNAGGVEGDGDYGPPACVTDRDGNARVAGEFTGTDPYVYLAKYAP